MGLIRYRFGRDRLSTNVRFASIPTVNSGLWDLSRCARSCICSAAQPYSITSSARASSVGGSSKPSALAVLRLMHQLELGRLLHRQVGGFCAFENAGRIDAKLAIGVGEADPIAHQPARDGIFAKLVDGGQPHDVPRKRRCDRAAYRSMDRLPRAARLAAVGKAPQMRRPVPHRCSLSRRRFVDLMVRARFSSSCN